MNTELYVNGNEIRFFINLGWYRGEEFSLFKLELFNKSNSNTLYIIQFKIAKFDFTFGFDWEK